MSTLIIAVAVSEDRPRGKVLARGTQENFRHLKSFHRLCAKFGIIPTYFLSYPALRSERLNWLTRAHSNGACELGTMMQSWTTPPFDANENRLANTASDRLHRGLVLQKLETLTTLFHERFGKRPVCHMGEGWDYSSNLIQSLITQGYEVDCSYAPGLYDTLTEKHRIKTPFFPSLQHPHKRGFAPVLEVPILTTRSLSRPILELSSASRRLTNFFEPWFDYFGSQGQPLEPTRFQSDRLRLELEYLLNLEQTPLVLPFQSYDLGIGTSALSSSEPQLSDLLSKIDQMFRFLVDEVQCETIDLKRFASRYLKGVVDETGT